MQAKALAQNFDFKSVIPAWTLSLDGHEITREFVFTNFKYAFEFMGLCAQYAEQIDHHPDWSNSWNKVSVRLSTHSVKTLSELDILMAEAMDRFAQQVSQAA
jgi:4a-hydroxytetrahydrobiopterin dehydratase